MPVQLVLGGHTLSGACLEPRALNELFPDWKDKGVRKIPELLYNYNKGDIPCRKCVLCQSKTVNGDLILTGQLFADQSHLSL